MHKVCLEDETRSRTEVRSKSRKVRLAFFVRGFVALAFAAIVAKQVNGVCIDLKDTHNLRNAREQKSLSAPIFFCAVLRNFHPFFSCSCRICGLRGIAEEIERLRIREGYSSVN